MRGAKISAEPKPVTTLTAKPTKTSNPIRMYTLKSISKNRYIYSPLSKYWYILHIVLAKAVIDLDSHENLFTKRGYGVEEVEKIAEAVWGDKGG